MPSNRTACHAVRIHRRRPRRTLLPPVVCAAALLSVACNEGRSRPGLEPSVTSDSSSTVVYGRVRQFGNPVVGARVGAMVRREDCTGRNIARIPGTYTDHLGAYRIELAVKSEPFRGCVLLEVDADLDTLRPDTVVEMPGVRFRPFPPTRDSVRKDVTLIQP